MCPSYLGEEKGSVRPETLCITAEKSATLVLSHNSVWFIIVVEASPPPRSPDITSLTGAHMQMKPVFIRIDDYILKQPAMK